MITYLKRRLSSGDLQGELADKRENEGLPSFLRFGGTSMFSGQSSASQAHGGSQAYGTAVSQQQQQQQQPHQGYPPGAAGRSGAPGDVVPNRNPSGSSGLGDEGTGTAAIHRGRTAYPSAPTSPHRSSSLGGSFMGSITGQISSTIMRGLSTAATTAQGITTGKSSAAKEKILFIIDDSQTDWCKYFKGKRLAGEWDVRVEQAQFSDISMTAYSNLGCVVNVYLGANRIKPSRSFRPDFILLRQHATGEAGVDWQSILIGLMYSRTPCMNTVHAVYNMKNRPWLFAHLLLLRNRLGKEAFPLISQTYHTDHRELVTAPSFPTVVKIGFGHKGEGKIRVDGPMVYQDVASLLAASNTYATNEPYVDAKCDIHVQKIGHNYKAFVRKSVSGNWKVNTGPVIIEKVAMNDRFKLWADEVCKMFGGLDICSVEAVQSKTGEQFIYEVNGSDMDLFGESQEEDRREIASLVLQRMSELFEHPKAVTKAVSLHSINHGGDVEMPDKSSLQARVQASPGVGLPTTYQPTIQAQQSQKLPPQHHMTSRVQQQASLPAQHAPQTAATRQNAPEPPPTASYGAPGPVGGGISSIQPITVSNLTQDHSPLPGAPGSGSSYTSSTGSAFSSSAYATTPQREGQASQSSYAESGTPTYGSQAASSNSPFGNVYRPGHPGAAKSAVPSDWTTNTFGSGWNSTDSSSQGASMGLASNSPDASKFTGYVSQASVSGDESLGSQRPQASLDYSDGNVPRYGGPGRQTSTASTSAMTNQTEHGDSTAWASSKATPPSRPFVPPRQTSLKTGNGPEETDDTMKNLRKTFAGIFGDM